jgi:hypothetical protein
LKVEQNSLLVRFESEVKVLTEAELKQLEATPTQQPLTKLASVTLQNGTQLIFI